MRAAIYARYSSDNQRLESITDQVAACRRFAAERSFVVEDAHIYSDEAVSGSRPDRPGLSALMDAAKEGAFEVVLVDDLSRLHRNVQATLMTLGELHYINVSVISVTEGVDTRDENAELGIQIRSIFNEQFLRDLKKKTHRGQLGQKQRGFFVGEATYGYKSVPVGEMRLDKKNRPRPEGYHMSINPEEARVVLRIFTDFASGQPLTRIVRDLNAEGVPGSRRSKHGWSSGTVTRILAREKYIGIWT